MATHWNSILLSSILAGLLLVPMANAETPNRNGLILWLDATDHDGDSHSTPIASEFRLSRWFDKSGKANHIEQLESSHQPAMIENQIGGQRVVRFDGNDSLIRERFDGFTIRDQPIHMVFVIRSDDEILRPQPRVMEFQPVDGDIAKPTTVKQHGIWIGPWDDGRVRIGTHYGANGSSRTVAWDGEPHLVEVVYSGAQRWVHYLDGVRDGGGLFGGLDFHGFTKPVRLAIGQQYGSPDSNTFFAGDIGEILVYNRPLSPPDQIALRSYLSKKWSLDLTLQSLPHFEQDVFPILAQHCHACHGADLQESQVDLRTVSAMMRGGKSGPVISRGQPEFSDLLEQITAGKMPPEDANPLDSHQIEILRRWIEAGAPADEKIQPVTSAHLIRQQDRAFWAYQKLQHHPPPAVKNKDRVRNAIDAFLLSKLERHGLTFAPPADRPTSIRRVFFDLTGLPPSRAEIAAYVSDDHDDAYERLVDRLLESPHVGERFARSWLDWAGYVDVYGKDNDFAIIKPLEGRWRYRDYVIRAFNDDKPFNRFLLEQLAGDEMVDWRNAEEFTPEIVELLTATGFLLCSDDDSDQLELNTPDIRHNVLQQTGEIVANNLFALTVQCAKCHNHKYEAIPQLDYYKWLANFSPVFNPQRWVTSLEHGMPNVSHQEKQKIDHRNQQIDNEIAELAKQKDELYQRQKQSLLEQKLTKIPESIRSDLKSALATEPGKRKAVQRYLTEKLSDQVNVSTQEIEAAFSKQATQQLAAWNSKIRWLPTQKYSYHIIQVAVEQNPPSPTYLLRRGDISKPGVEVTPSLFSILTESDLSIRHETQPQGTTSGRRLAIAHQVTDPHAIAGMLVARVFVNRLWQELFGQGIVASSDNFGVSGTRPTHPELLDWLTADFIGNDWKIKRLIRMMMLSGAYRQSSIRKDFAEAVKADPSNSLLWKARLRRLDSEYVRDRVLAVSGKLDRQIGGPPVPLLARPDGKIVIKMAALPTPTSHLRRSLYVLNRRHYHLSMLTTFDQPFLTSNCTIRKPSAVVTQALTMLNDEFVAGQAVDFADRVRRESNEESIRSWVNTAFQTALCRNPKEKELQLCIELVERQSDRFRETGMPTSETAKHALVQLCQLLFNTNEFLYVH